MKRLLAFTILGAMPLAAADTGTLAEAAAANETGQAAHRLRNLGESSRHYDRVLELDPVSATTDEHRRLVLKFAPRLFTVSGEFFPLKDIVAVLHPDRPVIGYHLFWEDDLGFPADNDPCDHEIVWVEYDRQTERVTGVHTYFHGLVLNSAEAVADANAHGGRPWIAVEWGFHGSVPRGGFAGAEEILRRHWERARQGRRPQHPLARGWPERFEGDYAAYTSYSMPLDPIPALRRTDLVVVSRWANAAIARHCLRYNFAPKVDWPWLNVIKP